MKKVLVTGANKGIGKAICQRLLEEHPDVHVLLASRDVSRGQQAIADLIKEVPNCQDRLELVQLDVSSDDSVQKAAGNIQGPLYGIVNNAGIGNRNDLQKMINTNYQGTRRVCEAFLSKLQTPGGRIVNVSSASGPIFVSHCQSAELASLLGQPWTIEDLDSLDNLGPGSEVGQDWYGFSKALVNAYTWMLAKENPKLVINAVTPGWIATDTTKGFGQNPTTPPSVGAIPPVYLLMDQELEKVPTGRYYGSDCKRSPLHEYRGPGDPVYEGPDGK